MSFAEIATNMFKIESFSDFFTWIFSTPAYFQICFGIALIGLIAAIIAFVKGTINSINDH